MAKPIKEEDLDAKYEEMLQTYRDARRCVVFEVAARGEVTPDTRRALTRAAIDLAEWSA